MDGTNLESFLSVWFNLIIIKLVSDIIDRLTHITSKTSPNNKQCKVKHQEKMSMRSSWTQATIRLRHLWVTLTMVSQWLLLHSVTLATVVLFRTQSLIGP